MRGKVSIFSPPNYNIRITPAYAGKSLGVGVLWIHDKDHPHLCGEKNASDCGQAMRAGSPPPMRGKVSPVLVRAIPDTDHPRLCGEKHVFPALAVLVLGSPPPMRGKVKTEFIPFQKQRITPAYAGKRDHPLYSQQNG